MKAMILAAGKGTRMRPVTDGEIPKPMVDLGPGPLLEHTLNHIIDFGVEEIIINLQHRGEVIREYFGEEYRGTPIYYSEEEELLGTAGGVKNVESRLDDTFLLFYGDILTDIEMGRFLDYHRGKDAEASILVYEEEENIQEASIILLDEDSRVQEFIEKPSPETVSRYRGREFWTNGGVYILEPSVLEYMPEGFSDFSEDVFPMMLEDSGDLYGYPLPDDTYWHEVGNPERYEKALEDVDEGRISFRN